ncbi:dynein axonemal intermediate chain 1-like isoform X3 [Phyllopteryx taeniolatus]|uniref:dynein axonemal intermediate chain 1-like isoform X3 n=1 Tax=Phyllopteryx taeniolatus TaxID=161469 RepID=UPI002AD3021F|nr:dynein axonemal intermediate chain 1-like isoform X3 [Phyllopteryx taeniolatus]
MSKDQAPAKSYKTTNKKKDDDDPGKLVKPADQLELSETELKEEMTRTLTARNPHAPQNIAHYKFNDGAYKLTTAVNHMAVHFVLEGCLEHQDFDDSHSLTATEELTEDATGEGGEESDEGESGDGGEEEAGEDDIPDSAASKANNEPKCTNQFNFIERASQTINNPLQGRSCQTVPPPRYNYYATAYQWDIYDVYMAELQKQEVKKEKQKDKSCEKNKKMMLIEKPSDDITQVSKSAKLLERMVNQNTFNEVAQDFKYFEDAADEFRDEEGTVLPLWKFHYDKAKTMCVTALCWNFIYPDFFGVGLGSYDFNKQGCGMLLFYTLKNSTFPEYAGRMTTASIFIQCLLMAESCHGCSLRMSCSSQMLSGLHWIILCLMAWRVFRNSLDCSKNYSSQYLKTYDGHNMAVDTVRWNPYHPKVFISCSSDWTVKIWDQDFNPPMFTFELNALVSDVAWAPYSSTVFAAVTTEGLVHVFDLAINKYQAICQQPVVNKKKTKLTHIEFNPVDPVVIVGDDRGSVISLKLSPNLRKKPKGKKGRDLVEGPEAEVAKMEKLLSLLRH